MVRGHIAHIITTLCGVGYARIAPGTVASLMTIMIWLCMGALSLWWYVSAVGVLFIVGVWGCNIMIKTSHHHDPSHIVIDEVVGMLMTLILLPAEPLVVGAAFVLFRFFDISKLPPVSIAERHVPGAWGIMVDDVMAAIMARITLELLFYLL